MSKVGRRINSLLGPRNIARMIKISRMHREGKTYREIGESLNPKVTPQAVKYQIDTHGLWESSKECEELLSLADSLNVTSEEKDILIRSAELIYNLQNQIEDSSTDDKK